MSIPSTSWTKTRVLSSLLWKLLERGGSQGIQFIIQVILARLLSPKDYGIIALLQVSVAISGVFVQSGFQTALIQKRTTDEVDYSSVFYISLAVATCLYIVLFTAAPLLGSFYNAPQSVPILRIMALILFFGAINLVQYAIVSRNMQFKMLFYSSTGATVISGAVGIVFAYMEYGAWALAAQILVNQIAISAILWFTVKWRPKLLFSFARVRGLFAYGSKLLTSELINTLYINMSNIIIGKVYTTKTLGFFSRGQQFPMLIVSNIDGAIQSVMLPTLSSNQDDIIKVKSIVRRAIMTSSFIIFPTMFGLASISKSLVAVILTEKWLPCVPYLQLFCLAYALWPIHTANLQSINALGRSDLFLKLEVVKKVLGILILAITVPRGVIAIAVGNVASGIICTLINAYPNKKLINYSIKEQWLDMMPSLVLAFCMSAIVFSIQFLGLTAGVTLPLQIGIGILTYLGLAYMTKLESFTYVTSSLVKLVAAKRGSGALI